MNLTPPPPLIAVIGSDGSGKSTVCEHLITCINKYGPTARVHLGKQAGNVERQLVKFPILGRFLRKSIDRNKVSVEKSHPGPLAALVIMSFVLRRLLRFRRMLKLQQKGMIILADRFPQVQIPGAYDGTLLPSDVPGSPFVTWLAGRERAAFQWMTRHKPDLVIKLNVDLEVACARKPDHCREAIAKKVVTTSKLTFEGAKIIDINANNSLEDVLDAAEDAVSHFMESQGYIRRTEGESVAIP